MAQQVDVLLSCGHLNYIKIDAAILAPRIGDEIKCNYRGCGKKALVQSVGIPWHIESEEEEETKPKIQKGQKGIGE